MAPARMFGTFPSPVITEEIIKDRPKPKIIVLTSNAGIKTKTVRKVPIILPIVAAEYKFPAVIPSLERVFVANFTAYGDIMPSKKVGTIRIIILATKAADCSIELELVMSLL